MKTEAEIKKQIADLKEAAQNIDPDSNDAEWDYGHNKGSIYALRWVLEEKV